MLSRRSLTYEFYLPSEGPRQGACRGPSL